MKITIIVIIAVAIILLAGTFGVMALIKSNPDIPCSSCNNQCNANSNCGSVNCGALNNGECNCSLSSGCKICNGDCNGNCGSSQCSSAQSAEKICGCNK